MGRLLLIPSFIGSESTDLLPNSTLKATKNTTIFIVERERTARAFLKQIEHPTAQADLIIHELNKHQNYQDFQSFFDQHIQENDIGVLSEAGLPAVADPGGAIVKYAHKKGIEVCPLAGSSSLYLALMASGMDGQHFEFKGYLPIDTKDRLSALNKMEKTCSRVTQIFMETPYRNNDFLAWLLLKLHKDTTLCVACDLETDRQWIRSKPVSMWTKGEVDLHKRPCVYLIHRS